MAGAISFSGLGSGMDTKSIVDALVNVERAPINALNKKKQSLFKHQRIYKEVGDLLKNLNTESETLKTNKDFFVYKSSSSNTDSLKVSAGGDAIPGAYDLYIESLASAQRDYSTTHSSKTAALGIAGTFTIKVAEGTADATSVDVTVSTDMTLSTLASAINSASAGVTAGIMFDGTNYRMQVSGESTGASNAVTYAYSSTTGDIQTALSLSTVKSSSDATIFIDPSYTNGVPTVDGSGDPTTGFKVSRNSNTITDLLPGINLDLTSTGQSTVEIKQDEDGIVNVVESLLDKYNRIAYRLTDELSFKGYRDPGRLQGDMTLRSLQSDLSALVGSPVESHGGTYNSFPVVGIKSGEKGNLVLERDDFLEALREKPAEVAKLFVTDSDAGTTGMADQFEQLVDNYTLLGEGSLWVKDDSISKQTKNIDTRITTLEGRLDAYRERLNRQFLQMESMVLKMNSQQQYLSALGATSTNQAK
ncbi:MAG: flagellar filament capping protein FliD [Deltaproteobacteria bacterium]|jgi:flagellar hook-associated protein 2|nr:flagellar filament capping protein FliD [Deltaproteobacteria bacterium]MBT6434203.1 flagellar filament capping protein FliD [Deltaproteobacteria bacterium]MBT6488224.1 flagellar filament capping protein FliD [Deltaproteobacteria bacterium]